MIAEETISATRDGPVMQEPHLGASRRLTNTQVLLGVFIIWQILYTLVFNVVTMVQDLAETMPKRADGADVITHLAADFVPPDGYFSDINTIFRRWGELTSLDQNWCLFAPNVGSASIFLDVELRWDDAEHPDGDYPPVMLPDANMPGNIESYIHWGQFRLRKHTSHFDLELTRNEGETQARMRKRWRAQIERKIRRQWDDLLAYLNWRWLTYRKDHTDRGRPRQVILFVRRYTTPPPDELSEKWTWDGPHVEPIARWRPDFPVDRDHYPLEMYNPVTRRFERLKRGG